MALANPNKYYKNPQDGKWYKPDPLAPTHWRPATDDEIKNMQVGPLNIEAGRALGPIKNWTAISFSNDADALKEHLESGGAKVVKVGDRPFDLAVSQDGGKTYKLIDPAPRKVLPGIPRTHPHAKVGGKILDVANEALTDPIEFVRDILDLGIDITQGALTSMATVGGAIVAPLTAAGAGAGTEYLRQQVGHTLGLNNKVDPFQVGVVGALSGAAPAASSAINLLRRGTPILQEGAAKLVSAKADQAITDVGVLKLRIADPAKASQPVANIERDLADLRKVIATVSETDFPEKAITDQMEKAATKTVNMVDVLDPLVQLTRKPAGEQAIETTKRVIRGTEEAFTKARQESVVSGGKRNLIRQGERTDLTADIPEPTLFGSLVDETIGLKQSGKRTTTGTAQTRVERTTTQTQFKPVEELESVGAALKAFVDTDLPDQAKDTVDLVYGILRKAGVNPTDVPAPLAARIKDAVWKIARESKALNGRPVTNEYKRAMRDLGGRIAESTAAAVDQSVAADTLTGMNYSQLMAKMHGKMNQLDYWKQAAGVWEWKLDPATGLPTHDKIILDEVAGVKKITNTAKNLWGETYQTIVRLGEQFKQDFGVDVVARMKRPALALRIGKEGAGGAMGIFPHITAVGGVPLAGTVTAGLAGIGGGLGFMAGDIGGAIAGGVGLPALAGTLASPRFIVGAGKALSPYAPAAARLQAALAERQAQAAFIAANRPLQHGATAILGRS